MTGAYHQELRVLRQSGATRWVEAVGHAERDAEGHPVRMVGTVRDVTARHEMDEALRSALAESQAAVRARDELVSHDLENPLGTMVLGITFLEDEVREEGRRALDKMARQTRRMNKMIDELLDVAQLNAGVPLGLVLRETDLVPLVRERAERLTARVDARWLVGGGTLPV